MRKADRERYKKLLLAKKQEMLEAMGLLGQSQSSTIREHTGDLSSYSYHMADQGTDQMDREMTFAHSSKGRRLIYHIDEALRRIEDGTYGKCHHCGKNIQPNRLKVVPHARLCIQCKEEEEKKEAGRKRR